MPDLPDVRIGEGYYNAGQLLRYLETAIEKMVDEMQKDKEIQELEAQMNKLRCSNFDLNNTIKEVHLEHRQEVETLKKEMQKLKQANRELSSEINILKHGTDNYIE